MVALWRNELHDRHGVCHVIVCQIAQQSIRRRHYGVADVGVKLSFIQELNVIDTFGWIIRNVLWCPVEIASWTTQQLSWYTICIDIPSINTNKFLITAQSKQRLHYSRFLVYCANFFSGRTVSIIGPLKGLLSAGRWQQKRGSMSAVRSFDW